MIVWWLAFPLLVLGMWYSIKHRLRQVSPIVIFTTMLTLVYSIFQGNVGTAYRQRSQLLVFYFIFVAVGADHHEGASGEPATATADGETGAGGVAGRASAGATQDGMGQS